MDLAFEQQQTGWAPRHAQAASEEIIERAVEDISNSECSEYLWRQCQEHCNIYIWAGNHSNDEWRHVHVNNHLERTI